MVAPVLQLAVLGAVEDSLTASTPGELLLLTVTALAGYFQELIFIFIGNVDVPRHQLTAAIITIVLAHGS